MDAPSVDAGFCGACGTALTQGEHPRCADRLRYDPPRFCARCGFRLDVQVYPHGLEASCRRCSARDARKVR